jgi:hypothetical protein
MPSWIPTSDYVEPALSSGFVGPITIVQSAISRGAQISLPPHSVVTLEFDAPGVSATQP